MLDMILHRFLGVPYALHLQRFGRRQRGPILVLLHGIGSSTAMWQGTVSAIKRESKLSKLDIVTVDLLGFGRSKRPSWAKYNLSTQARSLRKSIRRITAFRQTIVVGHSLGSLVAVEYAKRYPVSVDQLVLLSPPFYRKNLSKLPTPDRILEKIYTEVATHPEHAKKVLIMGKKVFSNINSGYSVDETNSQVFLDTLTSSIVNQTSYEDALELKTPTTVLTGSLDPLVIDANISSLAKQNPNIRHKKIALAAHEVRKTYRKELLRTLVSIVRPTRKTRV